MAWSSIIQYCSTWVSIAAWSSIILYCSTWVSIEAWSSIIQYCSLVLQYLGQYCSLVQYYPVLRPGIASAADKKSDTDLVDRRPGLALVRKSYDPGNLLTNKITVIQNQNQNAMCWYLQLESQYVLTEKIMSGDTKNLLFEYLPMSAETMDGNQRCFSFGGSESCFIFD